MIVRSLSMRLLLDVTDFDIAVMGHDPLFHLVANQQ